MHEGPARETGGALTRSGPGPCWSWAGRLFGATMVPKHLTWICASLFVLFGAAALLTEAADWRRFLGGLSVLSLGAFAVSMVRDALASGQIRLQYSVIRRAQQPRLFWAAILAIAVAGMIVLIGGLWLLSFES